MSVLIKGMSMPKECVKAEIYKDKDDKWVLAVKDKEYYTDTGFAEEFTLYELVEVPTPHGDLIDRTKLYNDTANWEAQALEEVAKYDPSDSRDEWRWWSAVLGERGAFKHDVADAPTVIEAEVEE